MKKLFRSKSVSQVSSDAVLAIRTKVFTSYNDDKYQYGIHLTRDDFDDMFKTDAEFERAVRYTFFSDKLMKTESREFLGRKYIYVRWNVA